MRWERDEAVRELQRELVVVVQRLDDREKRGDEELARFGQELGVEAHRKGLQLQGEIRVIFGELVAPIGLSCGDSRQGQESCDG